MIRLIFLLAAVCILATAPKSFSEGFGASESGLGDACDSSPVREQLEKGLILFGDQKGQTAPLSDRMAHYKVPGLSIAVLYQRQCQWAGPYGLAQEGQPVLADTLFQSASLSKPITAIAVMRLVEEGILDLDADIQSYLTSWRLPKGPHSPENPVTIRHILAHTAGFNAHGFPGFAPGYAAPSAVAILDGKAPTMRLLLWLNKHRVRIGAIPVVAIRCFRC